MRKLARQCFVGMTTMGGERSVRFAAQTFGIGRRRQPRHGSVSFAGLLVLPRRAAATRAIFYTVVTPAEPSVHAAHLDTEMIALPRATKSLGASL